jgi:hypothetical protein
MDVKFNAMDKNKTISGYGKRIMTVFRVVSIDDVPDVNGETLKVYFDFLNKHLTFPIKGNFTRETGSFKHATHNILLENLENIDEEFYDIFAEGIEKGKTVVIPLAEFEFEKENDINFQLIDDYKTWFWNYR